MRVVFLDFDGVLNSARWCADLQRKYAGFTEADRRKFDEAEWFDPALVARAGALCLEAGAVIAVHSSWRARHPAAALRDLLRRAGLPRGVPVARCAPGCSKGEAVARFLRAAARWDPVESYAVLDDEDLSGELPDPSRHVRVDGSVGLTEADAVRARALLLLLAAPGGAILER